MNTRKPELKESLVHLHVLRLTMRGAVMFEVKRGIRSPSNRGGLWHGLGREQGNSRSYMCSRV